MFKVIRVMPLVKGVVVGYGIQLYLHCLLKYVRLKIPPQFLQASWQHKLLILDMGSLRKLLLLLLSFHSCALGFLYLIALNNSVLLLYACDHKISLKYLFPEKIAIDICCPKYQGVQKILCDKLFFLMNFKCLLNKQY